ncbi:MAG: 4'-phosphopantetheinyl transferase superfamily protein [Firmicutes bacterium]|nr:4'-phosphopantetheinyl transferase superfamily protein [Bacillota bacterium]
MELLWQRLDGQDAHAAGRALLRRLCGGELPEIAFGAHGKPYFPADARHFSISHCANHVFVCLSARAVGLDAEEKGRRVSAAMPSRVLSGAEYRRWEAAPNRDEAFLRLWVLKEAAAKRSGEGIFAALRGTDFSPDDPRVREIDGCFVAILED